MIGPDLYTFRALWRHYRACRRNKRNTHNALAFEVDAEANLLALQTELRAHTYRPGPSICFITAGPKPREVFAADFRDRVVHHLLVAHQERVFERLFIHDSFACRRGKGTLAASDRLMAFLRRVTANGRRAAWALKLDVASFFPSIHKETLYDIIVRHVRHPELLWLTRTLLFHDPTTSYHFRSLDRRAQGPGHLGYAVPPRKSLFGKDNERGLPIGNLTSQFWGNVYLNELDHFVKRRLRCRCYLRYVDDVVVLSPDPAELACARTEIETFLRERLRLELRADGGSAPPSPPTPGTSDTAGPGARGHARGSGIRGSAGCSHGGAGRSRSAGRRGRSPAPAASGSSTGCSSAARARAVSSSARSGASSSSAARNARSPRASCASGRRTCRALGTPSRSDSRCGSAAPTKNASFGKALRSRWCERRATGRPAARAAGWWS